MKKPLLFFAFFLIPFRAALAQESLTWDACVKEASIHNLDLLSAEQSLKASENSHLASLGQFLPQINVGASLNRSGADPSIDGALNDPNYGQNASLNLSASENIFSGFRDIASVDSSNAQLDLAK
ncbi:MAG TPA: TolC family protein, partial [bacterium]